MRAGRNLLAVAAVIICCLAVLFATSIKGGPKTYEVQPWITVPEYRTDAARAINAYERLMDRYMDLTEHNLFNVSTDVRDVLKRLDCVDQKLTEVCVRIARIEKALGIEQPIESIAPIEQKPQPTPHGSPSASSGPLPVTDYTAEKN